MLDEKGYEIPDNTVVEKPTRLRLPTSRAAQIQGYIRAEMSRQAEERGFESFAEANDLDVEENLDFGLTAYEKSGEFGLSEVEYIHEYQEARKPKPVDSPDKGQPVSQKPDGGAPVEGAQK